MGAQIASQEGKPPLRITGASAESHRLHNAGGQRAGEIVPAVCRTYSPTARRASKNRCAPATTARSRCAPSERNSNARVSARETKSASAAASACAASKPAFPGDLSSAAFFLCAAALVPGFATDGPEPADESHARPPARHPDADRAAHFGHATRRDSRRTGGIAAGGRRPAERSDHRRRRLGRADRRDPRAGGDRAVHRAGNRGARRQRNCA